MYTYIHIVVTSNFTTVVIVFQGMYMIYICIMHICTYVMYIRIYICTYICIYVYNYVYTYLETLVIYVDLLYYV